MKYAFHPEAEAEFRHAINYYEDCAPGLGYDFAIEVHSTIENIRSFPDAWSILEDDIRRCQIRRFPYGIVYSKQDDVIFILAVMHLHRDPEYWKNRV
ncbi:type II toxin-antitoxin system RelE/ParE family toxin [Desulfoferrobacter suflitae]|uniref:type II toxin-antitoxin system RelE/ParE family toxin n=1 Tax=Desulfoferrobacter suflitae TaxID=2865782 RepID=UPI002164E49D|nr:type II toxin-antitoxin system RelE/ParE family toxin [Desulfoferrobacter suflitae]MCK8604429.1 type II toxin-antitoxin system RelE/ParE family toxin [Desulfoferrobacter suflitae]